MLGREIWAGFCLPRFVFILADGLVLALIWWQPIIGMGGLHSKSLAGRDRFIVACLLCAPAPARRPGHDNGRRHWLPVAHPEPEPLLRVIPVVMVRG
jgi:hypothetical protein